MIDSNTSRYMLPGRLTPALGVATDDLVRLAADLRDCAAELVDDDRRTGMTATRAAGLMREAAGAIEGK